MAHPSNPGIHDIRPRDIDVRVVPGDQLNIGLLPDTGPRVSIATLFIAGDTDRERLENLLAISDRLRDAALAGLNALDDAAADAVEEAQ